MNEKIETFIAAQKNLTLCTCNENEPFCANCFYAFLIENNSLVFKSNRKTTHVSNGIINNKVAGTILPDVSKMGTIKGIQFLGKFIEPKAELLTMAQKIYYKRFPFALAMPGDIWLIELHSIKMTDNTIGIGNKISWERTN